MIWEQGFSSGNQLYVEVKGFCVIVKDGSFKNCDLGFFCEDV